MPTSVVFFFFFNDTATTEIYTLSLHDALPISGTLVDDKIYPDPFVAENLKDLSTNNAFTRSEEHTSELQSQSNLVCRLLLEKKKAHHTAFVRLTAGTKRADTCRYLTALSVRRI